MIRRSAIGVLTLAMAACGGAPPAAASLATSVTPAVAIATSARSSPTPSAPLAAQPAPAPTGAYLLTFMSRDPRDPSPSKTRVYLAQSNDAASWAPVPGLDPFTGNMPDVIRRGDRIYLYYLVISGPRPEVRVRRYDFARGGWIAETAVRLARTNGSAEVGVDPAITLDDRGKFVLAYLWSDPSAPGDPAECRAGTCTKRFRSATEVDGSDGTAFTVDPGDRATFEISAGQGAGDPDVYRSPAGYVLLHQFWDGRSNNVRALIASDVRGSYTASAGLPNGIFAVGVAVPAGLYEGGQHWIVGHGGPNAILLARSDQLSPLPQSAFRVAVSASTYPGVPTGHSVEGVGIAVNRP